MRAISRLVIATAAFVAAAAFSVTSHTAGAATPSSSRGPSDKAITASVMYSANPHVAFEALSDANRAAFLAAFSHQTSLTVIDEGGTYLPTAAERQQCRRPRHHLRSPLS
jgi:hypothetical protein